MSNGIKVQVLSLNHLYNLASHSNWKEVYRLQLLPFKNWIANLENNLPRFFHRKQAFSLVAIENNELIAFLYIKPTNIRGSCWSISLPIILKEPTYNTLREVKLSLFKASITLKSKNAPSWILKFPTSSNEEISIARELGFQPLRIANLWQVNKTDLNLFSSIKLAPKDDRFNWEKVGIENAKLLCKLEKSGESTNLKAISDRIPSDLLDKDVSLSRVYSSNYNKYSVALAGLIQEVYIKDKLVFKLVRDISFDLRLNKALPTIIKKLCTQHSQLFIETNNEDSHINQLFKDLGLHIDKELLILGRSSMKRNKIRSNISIDKTMESIIETITPKNNPLPSPTSTPR